MLILLYRRFFSGRLSNTRCSFTTDETCSAFGLRIARSARSGFQAIAQIARRLRRCGDACLVGDGKMLGWSELHDRSPREIIEVMRADSEGDAAIARMLHTRFSVALWNGDHASGRACRLELRGLGSETVERPRVVASSAVSARALERYRFSTRRAAPACGSCV